jgi:hypothetical protein
MRFLTSLVESAGSDAGTGKTMVRGVEAHEIA